MELGTHTIVESNTKSEYKMSYIPCLCTFLISKIFSKEYKSRELCVFWCYNSLCLLYSKWRPDYSYYFRFCRKQWLVIVYYVSGRIMRVITRRATMLAGDRSRGAISPASILSESRNHPSCAHWHIFYFMWLRRIYEFLCVNSNPIWKVRNCRDYRPSHLTFREYFRPFWFSRSCVVFLLLFLLITLAPQCGQYHVF